MHALIITLMALGLSVMLLVGGMNYLSATPGMQIQAAQWGASQIEQFDIEWRTERMKRGAPVAPNGDLSLPSVFSSPFGQGNLASLQWLYGTTGNGYWLCISGAMNRNVWTGLKSIGTGSSGLVVYMDSTCGGQANGAEPATWPSTQALTYWLVAP